MNQSTDLRRSDFPTADSGKPWTFLFMVFAAFYLFAFISAATPQRIRVDDPAQSRELVREGNKVLVDYGSFQLIELNSGNAKRNAFQRQAQIASEAVELSFGVIRTRSANAQKSRKTEFLSTERQFHLIQFVGPIKPDWRLTLEQLGVRIVGYIPQNAYLVQGTPHAVARLQDWAAKSRWVQWDGPFQPQFKIHPAARTEASTGQSDRTQSQDYAVQLLNDGAGNTNLITLIRSWSGAGIKRNSLSLQFRNLVVTLLPDYVATLAQQPEVVSIQPEVPPGLHDERQAQIVAGNLTGWSLTGPGYLTWLAEKGFTQSQFIASGFAVDISDSGIDNGTILPTHPGLSVLGDFNLGSRVVYARLIGAASLGSTLAGCDGHGTINAHILAGHNADSGGFPHIDAAGYHYGLGISPFVRIGSSVIFDPYHFTYPDYAELQSSAYHDNARISVNSWGTTNSTYSPDAQAYDALVRDAQPATSAFPAEGNQEMVIIFAAGNGGPGLSSVGSPATAKNVITVGASENLRSLNIAHGGKSAMGFDNCGASDATADSPSDLASFSSRGPTSDGRHKPDLVAPGTHVTGGVPQSILSSGSNGVAAECFTAAAICALTGAGGAGNTNNFFPLGQQFYTVSSGTSQSVPAVGGACALLRQYFINHQAAPPSPAMTKAYLMNSTRFLTGAYANDTLWSEGQGMGLLNLSRAFDDAPRILRDQLDEDLFTQSGEQRVFTGKVGDTNKPVRITLAWTDAPGSTVGSAYNNDLDVAVEIGGQWFFGNNFSGAFSAAGGQPDARNNVESVFLPQGAEGELTIVVTAANINSDGVPNNNSALDQDFALVAYNATATAVPRIGLNALQILEEGFFPTNGVIDPGETVTVALALENRGTRSATNLLATLSNQGGVTPLSPSQNYGDLTTSGAGVAQSFTFTAPASDCGSKLIPIVDWTEAGGATGSVAIELSLGKFSILTQAFSNSGSILIPESGSASVYPSPLNVSGMAGGIEKLSVTLAGYSHSWPDDVDVLLVGPTGESVLLMSDCGGGAARDGVFITFDDDAVSNLPDSGTLVAGTFKPTNIDSTSDYFPSVNATLPYGSSLAGFAGTDPNGVWLLYIRDDGDMDSGSVTQGWSLTITTTNLSCANGSGNLSDLSVRTSLSANPVFTDSNLVFTVMATNSGPGPAAFVTVSNSLPDDFLPQNINVSQGNTVFSGNILYWFIGPLSPQEEATMSIQGRQLAPGAFSLVSTISGGTLETSLQNNQWTTNLSAFEWVDGSINNVTNTPPVLTTLPNRIIHAGSTIQMQATAVDVESELDQLTFALLPNSPATARIDSKTGWLTWQTTDQETGSTNLFGVQVSDAGSPPLSSSTAFEVVVVSRPFITGIQLTNSLVCVTWNALPGQAYQLQSSTNLLFGEWQALAPDVVAVGPQVTHTNALTAEPQCFYRVLVLP